MARRSVATVDKDEEFVLALIQNNFKGAVAARAVGYSENGAAQAASRLLTKSNVQELLASHLKAIRDSKQFTIERMYEEWGRIAYSNMQDYTYEDEEGNTHISLPHGDRALMAAVKSVETIETERETEDGETITTRKIKITLHDKVTGMDKLSRLFGMWDGKEAPQFNFNGPTQVNDNRTITTVVVVTPQDAAEEYRKLLGR